MTAQGLFKARGRTPSSVAKRHPSDLYQTPAIHTERFLSVEGDIVGAYDIVWEPCAGAGLMVDALRAAGLNVMASDIDPQRDDIIKRDLFDVPRSSLLVGAVVTNPPFLPCSPREGGAPLVEHLVVTLALPYVALLLPATWMWATQRRGAFLRRHPPARIIPVSPRIDWDGRGSPSADHAWHVWVLGHRGPPLFILPEET